MALRTCAPVICFVLLAFGLAWLLALPLWLGPGLQHRWLVPIALLIMWTPAAAAFIVSRSTGQQVPLADSLGLRPFRPAGPMVRYCLAALLVAIAASVAALVVAEMVGLFRFDLQHFSAFEQALRAEAAKKSVALDQLPPLPVLVAVQLAMLVPGSLINTLGALGEEIGWRGWLLPRLMPLGTVPAIVVSGLIWGLWHAPLVLLGYNYGSAPGWLAMLCMIGMCAALGALLSWFRLRSGSVWPAAVGHGAVNASAGVYLLLGTAGQQVDLTQATLLGWTGWLVAGVAAWLLFRSGRGGLHGQAA